MTNIEEPAVEQDTKPKRDIKPIVKKALIWGGVALGAVAVFFLVKPRKDDEQEYLIIEESVAPDGTTTTTTVTPLSD